MSHFFQILTAVAPLANDYGSRTGMASRVTVRRDPVQETGNADVG